MCKNRRTFVFSDRRKGKRFFCGYFNAMSKSFQPTGQIFFEDHGSNSVALTESMLRPRIENWSCAAFIFHSCRCVEFSPGYKSNAQEELKFDNRIGRKVLNFSDYIKRNSKV